MKGLTAMEAYHTFRKDLDEEFGGRDSSPSADRSQCPVIPGLSLSKVLISWSNDEVDVEERLNLMTLLFENTRYEPTLEDQSNCSHHITLRLKLLLEKQEPKKLDYLSKISFRKNLIAYSNGQSIIQTIKESKIWPQPLLKRIYDI